VPASVQALDRAGLVYRPLIDEGVTTPIIMNRRRDDDSELTRFMRAIVCALPTSTLGKTNPGGPPVPAPLVKATVTRAG
jgi:hypothetical protein